MEFYGYKKCSTCRDAHKFLAQGGIQVEFQDFVERPPSVDVLKSWVNKLGQGVGPFINVKGTRYKELGLKDKQLSDEEWYKLLSEDGKLLKRPVLVTDNSVIVGFDRTAYQNLVHSGVRA